MAYRCVFHLCAPKTSVVDHSLAQAYIRSGGQRELLNTTLERVRKIVKQYAGPEYDVEDISMHTYSRHMHDAPFELAIVVSALCEVISHPSYQQIPGQITA